MNLNKKQNNYLSTYHYIINIIFRQLIIIFACLTVHNIIKLKKKFFFGNAINKMSSNG